ncbi:MAG TPA: tetratricopeptide repeat protein [Pyrinomonadaceae bacterium]|jgi:tetratricopeptide (TPR) repeat protein|nr:tetratricopeptide repeat protein [Pyrinomonadaceae bacterium]
MGFDKAKAIRAAEKYLAQGKIPAAVQEYKRVVEVDPEDYSALNTLGDLYARIDRKADALACYRRVADHYREQGFSLKAVAVYKKVSRFAPGDYETALALAALYEQQGLLADARAQYLIAADSFTRAGQGNDALDILRRIADLDPSDTKTRLRLAESYAQSGSPDYAAEAYTQAGERLASRGHHEQALDAFQKALALVPSLHAALQGMLAAHTALGTADDAADALEEAVAEKPGDLELRAMLTRAYVEAENAVRAEAAAEELYIRDPASFVLFYDVARLWLQQGSADGAARLLGRIVEPALNARQDAELLDMLQEILARDPEQMDALNLLVRVYGWRRDEERLRTALERLADAAETAGAVEDERRALAQLVLLAPDERRFSLRLEELGGPPPPEHSARPHDDVPTFESFMLGDDPFAARAPAAENEPKQAAPPPEFEWNSVAEPQPPGQQPSADASFAELNDATVVGGGPHEPPAFSGFQEIDFGAPPPAPGPDTRVEQMLTQELESVDFYIEQGYADIARDTLDMLERQYGPNPEIDRRRGLLPPDALDGAPAEAAAPAAVEEPASAVFDDATAAFAPEAVRAEAPDANGAGSVPAEPFAFEEPKPPAAPTAQAPQRPAGLDPGLAAIFDEFREEVEDASDAPDADYETHYNLGLAYREMGLLDQAVEEFQAAAAMTTPGDGTPRFLQCCNLLGHCFMEKGMPRPASLWFKRGLGSPGHTDDEYQALRFDLGVAYEQMGEPDRAIEVFSEVYAIDVSYRGVAERLRELEKTVNRES